MVLPRIRGGAWRLRWGMVALVITAPLAMAGTANAGTGTLCDVPGSACAESIQWVNVAVAPVPGSTATYTNVANETDTASRHAYSPSFVFQASSASEITAINTATATAECQGCDAIAIAFQTVVATQSTVSSIDATDTAEASANCACQALAEAFQLVTSAGLLTNSPYLSDQLQHLNYELRVLVNSGLDNSTIQIGSTADVDAFVALVREYVELGPLAPLVGHWLSFTSSRPYVYLLSEFHH